VEPVGGLPALWVTDAAEIGDWVDVVTRRVSNDKSQVELVDGRRLGEIVAVEGKGMWGELQFLASTYLSTSKISHVK